MARFVFYFFCGRCCLRVLQCLCSTTQRWAQSRRTILRPQYMLGSIWWEHRRQILHKYWNLLGTEMENYATDIIQNFPRIRARSIGILFPNNILLCEFSLILIENFIYFQIVIFDISLVFLMILISSEADRAWAPIHQNGTV